MTIAQNQVVEFHYVLKSPEGNVLESSPQNHPMVYLHGHGNILPSLEEAFTGKVVGDKFSVTLAPEQAYGLRQENSIQRVAVKHLHGASKWRPGMLAEVHTEHGARQVQVVKVGKFMADVDTNHPLAGQTLVFDIEIVSIRAASDDEVSHGHAHGPGGHHH